MNITTLIEHFRNTWFTENLVFLLNLFALKLCFKRKDLISINFSFYFLANLLVLTISWTIVATTSISSSTKGIIYTDLNTVIEIVELFTYALFFGNFTSKNIFNPLIVTPFILFLILEIIFLFTRFSFITTRFRYAFALMNVLEFSILITWSLIYYYKLFNTKSSADLFRRPSFWIVTGIFIFSVISTPFYLLNPLLFDLKSETRAILGIFLFQIPILLNLSLLIKGLLCKEQLAT